MSSFVCQVRSITVEPHPNADLLEIGLIDGYQFVVRKDEFKTGDLGIYFPEAALLPTALIEEMGLTGKLAGPEANRVKAIKLRGVLSQGLFYRPVTWPEHWIIGLNVANELGIIKWEPPIPLQMAGQVEPAPTDTMFRTYTDIEDIKRYPNLLQEGETVIMGEKLHGSCTILGVLKGQRIISSKGLASKHLIIKEEISNIYWRVAHQEGLFEKLERYLRDNELDEALLFGEVLGIQDLMYGLKKGTLAYRAFDLYINREFVSYEAFQHFCQEYEVKSVPIVYEGPFSKDVLAEHTAGVSTMANHIREGVVVRPIVERSDLESGRVILKSVSADYLVRKGGTELN